MQDYDSTFDIFFKWILPIGVIVAFAGFSLMPAKKPAPPPSSTAYGCYVYATDEHLLIDKFGFRLTPSKMKPSAFEIALKKSGVWIEFPDPVKIGPHYRLPSRRYADPGVSGLAIQVKLDTPELVDGIWISVPDGSRRLFERRLANECNGGN